MRSSKCNRCGRVLKNPVYIELGYGKVCAAKMGISIPSKKHGDNALKENKGGDHPETNLAKT